MATVSGKVSFKFVSDDLVAAEKALELLCDAWDEGFNQANDWLAGFTSPSDQPTNPYRAMDPRDLLKEMKK